ncbi:sensor histidine kinase [Cellulomonas composti]|uniref:histidine kinase n=1 Tax=Cellulomonas composti TaxID=266130 RepID=A0A511JCY5_9CELL|nr:HAMP domain-containing sensor histidine kinase [Cellulomonas composti]GEL95860.1 two-component sensor histidine kinase [Cellulomonas composti]
MTTPSARPVPPPPPPPPPPPASPVARVVEPVVEPALTASDENGTGPDDDATPLAAQAGSTRGLRARWAGVPLTARLVGIISSLLAIGLIAAGVLAGTLLYRTLIQQVDDKLVTEGLWLANQAGTTEPGRNLPTDYYGQFTTASGETQVMFAPRPDTLKAYGTPQFPELTATQAAERAGEPFTVSSSRSGERWRAIVYPARTTDGQDAVVAVALPLDDVQDTVTAMAGVLVASGLVILLVGALTGRWAVRRSLRPLREIETTAEAFAAGDFSQRVPTAPTSTEVGRLGAALNGMLAQIEQAFAVRTASEARMRRFVADASHELRTPLATIRGYGELYRMGALREPEQLADTMQRIESSATRMGGLVQDLLSLARLDERRPMRSAPVDLTVLAADAVSDLHALDPTRRTRLLPLLDGAGSGPVVVPGDEARLRQVVANLVGNVVQHTPAGTPVEIAVGMTSAADGTRAGVVEVRDHGPGIDPQHAARVFERFYRVDASRGRDSGGAGLGMAIVAAIVDAHAGQVGLEQTPGGGTTVRVTLPAVAHGPAGYDDAS